MYNKITCFFICSSLNKSANCTRMHSLQLLNLYSTNLCQEIILENYCNFCLCAFSYSFTFATYGNAHNAFCHGNLIGAQAYRLQTGINVELLQSEWSSFVEGTIKIIVIVATMTLTLTVTMTIENKCFLPFYVSGQQN